LGRGASGVAVAAVLGARLGVDASAVTLGQVLSAGDGAGALRADLVLCARRRAGSAIRRIGGEIDAGAAAIGQAGLAHAGAVLTHLAWRADVAERSAVVRVGHQVEAAARTLRETDRAAHAAGAAAARATARAGAGGSTRAAARGHAAAEAAR